MIELYDALSCSLNRATPLESMKYDKEFGISCLSRIQRFLYEHEGEMALLYKADGKKVSAPKLVHMYQVSKGKVILSYKCYDPEGNFRHHLTESVSCVDIYCRDIQLKVFGNI